MQDEDRDKADLIKELAALRQQVAALDAGRIPFPSVLRGLAGFVGPV